MAKNNSKEPYSMDTLGSKRQVIATLCNVVNYAMSCSNIVGVQELFAGGFCFSSHFESEYELKFRTANEVDYGVVSFFRCLQDPYKTDLLIEQIQLLADEYRTKDMFEKAKEERIKPETPQLRAAALTYIVVEYSLRADRQNFSQHHADKGIPHKSLSKLYDADRTIGDVQIFCGDYKEQFNKYKDRSDVLIYIDPPYLVTSITHKKKRGREDKSVTTETSGYVHPFTVDDHKELVKNLLTTKNKFILSGYLNDIYKPLEDEGKGLYRYFLGAVKISTGERRNEYIWCNFEIEEGILPEAPSQVDYL
ncbi:DNA adenine methylase [Lysinibacillus fusiformis]|uniref:DNA adenine methylase n=1 Tax=Lysinibacillus fusiformis TaxID=28031 RepID=UPI003D04D94B